MYIRSLLCFRSGCFYQSGFDVFDNINNQKNPDSAKYKKTFCKEIYKKQPHIGKQGESVYNNINSVHIHN